MEKLKTSEMQTLLGNIIGYTLVIAIIITLVALAIAYYGSIIGGATSLIYYVFSR